MSDPVSLYGRAYRITVGTLEIDSSKALVPLSVQFSVKKNLKPEPNKAEISIVNLKEDHRTQIDQAGSVPVKIEAGYKGHMSMLFLGDLRTSISVRNGPDFITSVASGDGEKAIRTARVNKSIKKGTPIDDVLKTAARAIGVSDGNLNQAVAQLKFSTVGSLFAEGTVLSGNAAREMTALCRSVGMSWSVQNGKLQLLPIGQALKAEAIKCSATTGMIGSPSVDNKNVLSVRMLMAPDIEPGRLLVLDSLYLKGNYRIEETTHAGDYRGNDWYVDIKGQRY